MKIKSMSSINNDEFENFDDFLLFRLFNAIDDELYFRSHSQFLSRFWFFEKFSILSNWTFNRIIFLSRKNNFLFCWFIWLLKFISMILISFMILIVFVNRNYVFTILLRNSLRFFMFWFHFSMQLNVAFFLIFEAF